MDLKSRHLTKIREIVDVIREHKTFCVLEHKKPDGDCIGSGLAMALALTKIGKRAVLVSEDPHPTVYAFLPGRHLHTRAVYLEPGDFSPEVAIFIDCTGEDRAGKAANLVMGRTWINIDHHISNSDFGDLNLVDPNVSAAGELVYEVIRELGVEITPDIATCLYVSIATDTGGFRYQNTTSDTHRLAAELLDKGVKSWTVSEMVFECRSLSSILLLGKALSAIKLLFDGKVALIAITQEMLRSCGATMEDIEGIINYPRSVSGVEVALVFKETEDGVHVSFRSKALVDVSAIAVSLGGGGHPRAAGAVLDGDLETVQRRVLSAIEKVLP
jgi:phosphoesterase RecJ-like protein